MPREIEEGIYIFRIKYTRCDDDSLEISYQRHHVNNLAHIPEILKRIDIYFERTAKGKVDVTYRFDSATIYGD